MKIGVIFCGYRCMDTLPHALRPWVDARAQRLGGHEWTICVISRPFSGFDNMPEDGTRDYLIAQRSSERLDQLLNDEICVSETEARGDALRWLMDHGADMLWQADADEIPTIEQISRILAFWDARPHACWARLSYRNLVFTPSQYLVQPFQPPRIHRVNVPGYRAHSLWDDNNVLYGGTITRDMVRDVDFASVTVPPTVALVDHFSWMNSIRSRRKCEYQMRRWGHSQFDWDDRRGGLIFRDGVPPPEVARRE